MASSGGDSPERGRTRHADDLARRERELERFRANIERLRRERAAAIDEFNALTRRTDESPPRPESLAPGTPGVVEDHLRVAPLVTSPPPDDVVPAAGESFDRFGPSPDAQLDTENSAPDLPDDETHAGMATPPDESLDFGALAEEDTVVDAAPRRAADRRRTLIVVLVGGAAVASVALWLWGPWARHRTDTSAVSSFPAGESGAREQRRQAAQAGEAAPAAAARVEPTQPPAPPAVAARPLVVQLATSRAVWIRAFVDGRPTVSRTVPAGEAITLEADALVTVRIGDAGAVRVTVNGRDRGAAGRDGEVLDASFSAKDQ